MCCDRPVNSQKLLQNRLQLIERKSVSPIRFSFRRVVVNFEEDAIHPGSHGCTSKDGDELGLAARDSVGG